MKRALSIGLRTAHLCAMGILLGGAAFDVMPEELTASLLMAVGTGVALTAVESGGHLLWFHQMSGVLSLAKVAFLCTLLWAGDHRLPVLLGVVIIGSIGSHMPGRFRHYSVVYRRVIKEEKP